MKILSSVLLLLSLQCSPSLSWKNVVCYYPNWAQYRSGIGQFTVSNINATLCTHMMYAFAVLDPLTYKIKVFDPRADIDLKGYANVVALKSTNPKLKVMIAVGGWIDSEDGKYSRLAASTANINTFVSSVVTFLKLYKFDGIDLDWEYPSTPEDKTNFVKLMAALKNALMPNGYLLSAAVPASAERVDQGYDLVSLAKSTDFLNLMAYDMHGDWEPQVNHPAPLYQRPYDTSNNNIDYVVNYYISKGYPASRINLGISLYGRSWTLSSTMTTPLAPASGPGAAGTYTRQAGTLAYYEICTNVQTAGWQVFQDSTGATGPYAVSPTSPKTWVGYDDAAMVVKKVRYLLNKGLGGAMVWDISMDDFRNTCGDGAYPLMTSIKSTLREPSPLPTTTLAPNTTTTTTTAPVTTTTPSEAFTCPTSSGLFPDPTNCARYFNCGNGIAYNMPCPEGLLFNSKLLYCDWSHNVICS